MSINIQPLGDRVLLKELEATEEKIGSIYVPDTAKEKPQKGEVVAVGNGKILEDGSVRKMSVKKGDKVLFSKYAGNEVKLDGDEVMIMREDEILAIIEK